VADEDRVCNCGCEKQLVRYETSERYDYQPEIYSVLEERREIMACPKGCEGSLQTAPLPKRVLPKIKATESLLAHIIVSKLHNRQPLYHLEKYTEMVNISRETMARWMIQLAGPLQPLLNLFKDEIIEYDVASLDATTLQVLKEPGRSAETKSYIYCMRGGSPEHATIVYDYNYERHKLYVDEWFEGFQGYIHMDADPFFEMLLEDEQVNAVNCHAHGRRKFEAITKQVKKQGLAHDALQFYKKLYKIEREAKNQAMTPEQRYHYRLEHSKPLLDKFKVWLDEYYPLTLPKSYLGKAMEYCLKRWDNFLCFLKDGRLEIDNNLTEQEIKPIVIARKNFMFADSVKGAHALCLHFSLIRTALAHKLAPYKYYKAILTRIPHCETVEDYEALLPWNIQL
jgi:transposase